MANNNSKIEIAYEEKLNYNLFSLSDVENKIDFWNSKKYYGKLNTFTAPVVAKTTSLKSIKTFSTKPTQKQYLINFVADAYNEFITEVQNANLSLKIPKSNYNPLIPKQTFLDPSNEYQQYVTYIMNVIYASEKNNIDNNITTYNEFLNLIVDYILATNARLTKTSYMLSNFSPSNTTGLVISFAEDKQDDDELKKTKWINDVNFEFFINTAAKYSFFVDKNAPWKLVFNLNTEYAKEKMSVYGIDNIQDMFDNLYETTYLTDFKKLKKIIEDYYLSKIKQKPKTQITEYCEQTKYLKFSTIFKSNDINKEDLLWIQFYYLCRIREENININQSQFDKNLINIAMLYNTYGETKALEWIFNSTKPFLDGGSNPSYRQYKAVQENKNRNRARISFTF